MLQAKALRGGLGNDLIIVGSGANQTLAGGGGTDTLSFANLNNAVTLHIDTGLESSASGNATISGFSAYNLGNGSNNVVYGSTGNDSVYGGSGNNLFYASLGSDTLDGGTGFQYDQLHQR